MIGRLSVLLILFILCSYSANFGANDDKTVYADTTIYLTGAVKAFPTAEGHGRFTTGGRGQSIYQVTNLNDSGSGSLRDAISSGNRIVVFRVGGKITLSSTILRFGGSNITIAGETAPGGGITVYGNMTETYGYQNIIMRNISFMTGDPGRVGDDDSFRILKLSGGVASDFIFDHCAFMWAKDENLSLEAANDESTSIEDVTIQKCVIGESFHGRGAILWRQSFRISFIDNLFSNNEMRSIRASTRNSTFEMINNVIYRYDWATNPSYNNIFDIIGNVYKSSSSNNIVNLEPISDDNAPKGSIANTRAYISDNTLNGGSGSISSNLTPYLEGTRQVSSGYTPLSNSLVTSHVLDNVGPMGNNSIVAKQKTDFINNTGNFYTAESQTLTLTITASSSPYTDADGDGMEDSWETYNGLNPANASDRNNRPASVKFNKGSYYLIIDQTGITSYASQGYTAVELYLAYLAGDFDNGGGGTPPPSPTCSDGIQNGDETGIDCGGSCPPCEGPEPPTPTPYTGNEILSKKGKMIAN